MTTFTFEADNYTGEKAKVTINKTKKTLTYNGDTFKYAEKKEVDGDMTLEVVTLDPDNLNLKATKLTFTSGILADRIYKYFTVNRYDISRSDESAFVALGKMLAMTY